MKLSPKDYGAMRVEIYNDQYEHCAVKGCERWVSMEQFHLHHIKSRGAGGDDSRETLIGVCYRCHDAIHRGKLRV